jgi:5-methylcytosine-specific restriction enzyme subunit McrC
MDNVIPVYEFEHVFKESDGGKIPDKAFKELRDLCCESDDEEETATGEELKDINDCIKFGTHDRKTAITFKNYVGTISLKCGTTIEILPKIFNGVSRDNASNARKIVVEMLKACWDINNKKFQRTNLRTERNLPLYEVLINLFLDELSLLCKKGLKADYVPFEDNERFLKGKLNFKKQIRYNFAHAERFYVEYDLFSFDRPENRLIKTTLLYLKGKSRDAENLRSIRNFISLFDEINISNNIEADFAKCKNDRTVSEYKSVMPLCQMFLNKKSATPYGGKNQAVALLFPMDKLFEMFIAKQFIMYAPPDYIVEKQYSGQYLFDTPQAFTLRPDIILKKGGNSVILDTKWKKLICDKSLNYGISQADMYQLYAYHTRYKNVKKVILLYPYNCEKQIDVEDYKIANPYVHIQVMFYNFENFLANKPLLECINPNAKRGDIFIL